MPLLLTMHARSRVLLAEGEREVTYTNFMALLEEIQQLEVLHWKQIIYLRNAQFMLNAQEVLQLGAHIRAVKSSNGFGALALVLPQDDPQKVLRLLGFLAAAERPMRIFYSLEPANKWLLSQPHR